MYEFYTLYAPNPKRRNGVNVDAAHSDLQVDVSIGVGVDVDVETTTQSDYMLIHRRRPT